MEKYIKELISTLCKNYGYGIIEFQGMMPGLQSTWGAVRRGENSAEVIFFSDANNYNSLDKVNFINSLKNALKCDNIRLIQILVGNNISDRTYPQCEYIFINIVDKKILYYSNGLESKVEELLDCMNRSVSSYGKSEASIITYILISVNVLAYILTAYLSGNFIDSNINVLVFLGAKVNYLIARGEYYRLVTCMFLHGGIVHLALNMYALYSLGPLIEKIYGKIKYLFIYFLAGIVSSIFSYMFSSSVSIGASGAIFGLLGAALVFSVKMKDRIGRGFLTNIMSVIAINLFMGFSMSNVDNFGHLGGLVGGTAITLLLGIGRRY
ncbi:rhomboid family intramembrane serine protease [Clostridium sp. P21]|uniref:Rhomboid family intramembrane serine protease n=1 Tax=Clostridium muellerianum TaxID=2716538 RepID=A0A7Y0EKA9_9CLOT|nr:rhomboid family intramembrane serine protease [Clostridium muellerianum]NMM65051.1 rhomboid family intramembrane serine protease [Clostridium muellerianum]